MMETLVVILILVQELASRCKIINIIPLYNPVSMKMLRPFQLKHYFQFCEECKYFNYNYVDKKIARYTEFGHSHVNFKNNPHIAY